MMLNTDLAVDREAVAAVEAATPPTRTRNAGKRSSPRTAYVPEDGSTADRRVRARRRRGVRGRGGLGGLVGGRGGVVGRGGFDWSAHEAAAAPRAPARRRARRGATARCAARTATICPVAQVFADASAPGSGARPIPLLAPAELARHVAARSTGGAAA